MMPALPLSSELLHRVQSQAAKVRIGYPFWLRMFLWTNVAAITIGRRIYVDPGYMRRRADQVETLIRHELVHVRQIAERGMLSFLFRYVRDYIRLRRAGLGSQAAYEAIPFEKEAREAELETA